MRYKINSVQYLDELYSGNWRAGYGDAVKRLERIAGELPAYENILDLGCAGGDFLRIYHKLHPKTILHGVDISPVVIKQAQEFSEGLFTVGDIYELPYLSNAFDMVNCQELFEHLQEPEKALEEIKRVLKPKGELILTTINEKAASYEEHLWKWDLDGFVELLRGFDIIKKDSGYITEHTMFIWAKKK